MTPTSKNHPTPTDINGTTYYRGWRVSPSPAFIKAMAMERSNGLIMMCIRTPQGRFHSISAPGADATKLHNEIVKAITKTPDLLQSTLAWLYRLAKTDTTALQDHAAQAAWNRLFTVGQYEEQQD